MCIRDRFRIYRITKPLNGIVTIYGQHISYDLANVPLLPFSTESRSPQLIPGIFTRDMMHDDDYSTAFFSESDRFFHNRMNGVLAQYNGKRDSYVEFVCDWEGMYSTLSREKFRILL